MGDLDKRSFCGMIGKKASGMNAIKKGGKVEMKYIIKFSKSNGKGSREIGGS